LQARLVKAGVPRDQDFINGLLGQLISAGDLGRQHDDLELSFLLSVIEGMELRDMIDAMLASQMAMMQPVIAGSARRLHRAIDAATYSYEANTFAKLVRTFGTLTEAFTRHRSGGGPNVSVGHVSISEGGQAIVGNVMQNQGEAAPDETAPSPPLLVDAKAVPMPSVENKERVPVPESRARTEESRTFEKK